MLRTEIALSGSPALTKVLLKSGIVLEKTRILQGPWTRRCRLLVLADYCDSETGLSEREEDVLQCHQARLFNNGQPLCRARLSRYNLEKASRV